MYNAGTSYIRTTTMRSPSHEQHAVIMTEGRKGTQTTSCGCGCIWDLSTVIVLLAQAVPASLVSVGPSYNPFAISQADRGLSLLCVLVQLTVRRCQNPLAISSPSGKFCRSTVPWL